MTTTQPTAPSPVFVAASARALPWETARPTATDKPRRSWREQVLVRANELSGLAVWMGSRSDGSSDAVLRAANADLDVAARDHLRVARQAALTTSGFRIHGHGARMERALAHLDAAEALVLRRSPDDFLLGQVPEIVAHVQAHLPPAHPLRVRVHELADQHPVGDHQVIAADDRNTLVEAYRAASWAARREQVRLRSFRTAIAVTAIGIFLLAAGIAILSARQPQLMPLCFAPQGSGAVVCPTGTGTVAGGGAGAATTAHQAAAISSTVKASDAAVVMLVGLAGAAVTGAAALRRMRGTSTPFGVPLTLLVLKLPTGALTAFLGLILLHGEFVPGLSALDTSGQILAWALIFGAAQQLVTGLIDKKAQSVLDSVGSNPMTDAKE